MNAVAFSQSSGLADVRQHAPSNLSNLHSPVCTLVHNSTPSQRHENGARETDMRAEGFPRNVAAQRTEIETRLVEAFTRAAPQYQVVAKSLGPAIGASARTIENYRYEFPQAVVNAAMLGRYLPAFGLEFMDIMNIDIDQDRAAFAEFLSLQRRIIGR